MGCRRRIPEVEVLYQRWPYTDTIPKTLTRNTNQLVRTNPSNPKTLIYVGFGLVALALFIYKFRRPIASGASSAYEAAKEGAMSIYSKLKASEILSKVGHLPLPQVPVEYRPPALDKVYPLANASTKQLLDSTPLSSLWGIEGFYSLPPDTATINSTRKIAESAQDFVRLVKPAVENVIQKYPFKYPDVAAKAVVAQAGHEGGWGKAAIGGTNIFGHVATPSWTYSGKKYSFEKTWEYDDKLKTRVETVRPFRVYDSLEEAFANHIDMIVRKWPDVLNAKSAIEYAMALMKKPAYATDPNYVTKIDQTYSTVNRYW